MNSTACPFHPDNGCTGPRGNQLRGAPRRLDGVEGHQGHRSRPQDGVEADGGVTRRSAHRHERQFHLSHFWQRGLSVFRQEEESFYGSRHVVDLVCDVRYGGRGFVIIHR